MEYQEKDFDQGRNIRKIFPNIATYLLKFFLEKIAKVKWYRFNDSCGEGDYGFSFFGWFVRFYKWYDTCLVERKDSKDIPSYRLVNKREIGAYHEYQKY